MDVRLEQPADDAAELALHHAAFGAHGRVVCRLIDALRAIEGLALVAIEADAVVGHVMFTAPCWTRRPGWSRSRS